MKRAEQFLGVSLVSEKRNYINCYENGTEKMRL